jgi:hypothetical protein
MLLAFIRTKESKYGKTVTTDRQIHTVSHIEHSKSRLVVSDSARIFYECPVVKKQTPVF